MTRYWSCPSCGATQDKGAAEAVQATLLQAALAAGGQVRCTACGAAASAQAVYDGQFDAPESPPQPDGPAASVAPSGALAPLPTTVRCPQCQQDNPLEALRCAHCKAELLPGRRLGERLRYLAFGLVIVAVLLGLAWLFARSDSPPQPCASPALMLIIALLMLVGSIRLALGRTPRYERHAKRAEQNAPADPLLALADLDVALGLAPAKERAALLKQRGELYARLDRKEEAMADLATFVADPSAQRGSRVLSTVVGLDLNEVATAGAERTIEDLRAGLMRDGALAAVGFCTHCRQAYMLPVGHACPQCGRPIAAPTYVRPDSVPAALATVRTQGLAALKAQRTKRILIWVAAGSFLACAGSGLIIALTQQGQTPVGGAATPTPAPVRAVASTAGIMSFTCPAGWQPITAQEVEVLLETSLEGLKGGTLTHIGGCYQGAVGDCANCAQIVAAVALVPGLPGAMTDAQYDAVKAATEKEMGQRLESFRRVEVSGMPGIESIHLGRSRKTHVWDTIVLSPTPGKLYMLSCSAGTALWEQHQRDFSAAVASLQITDPAARQLGAPQAPTARPEPTVAPKAPAMPTQPVAPTAAPPAVVAFVSAEALNLRVGPGADYALVRSVTQGDVLAVRARNEASPGAGSDWLAVTCVDGASGWVSAKHVQLLGRLEDLPVEAAPAP